VVVFLCMSDPAAAFTLRDAVDRRAFSALEKKRAREEHDQFKNSFACMPHLPLTLSEVLLGGAKEKVVGRVGHELGLTHSAGGSRNRSAIGVQALDESGGRQKVAAGGPLLVPH
jgi:hypothetical protein